MKRIVMGTLLFLIGIYILLFINTNSVTNYAKKVMLGKVALDETNNTPLDRYNVAADYPHTKMDAKITRLFVCHNFFDGYMWVYYSCEATDNDGDLVFGVRGLVSKWKIHREDGKWRIVDIDQQP